MGRRWMPFAAIAALVGVVVARTWLSDDAYITLRAVDNFVNGFGARWNVADRVQTFTHPLWMLLLSIPYAVTREPYFTTVIPGWILTTTACAILAFRIAATPAAGTLAVVVLALSAAFTDFSTGGLENPLTHATLAVFLLAAFASGMPTRRVLPAALAASCVALSRPDAVLLIAPPLAAIVASARSARPWARLAVGALPLVAWGAFSVVYYGFPWPNTAYAKLGTGIPAGELALQGTRYLLESLRNDPLTLGAIAVSLVLAVRRGDAMERAFAAGIALYLLYVVKIGGDFMSGRFLTAPLFVAAAILARRRLESRRASTALLAGTIVLGALAPRATWRVGSHAGGQPAVDIHGIANERAFYLDATGLAARLRSGGEIEHPARIEALRVKAEAPAVVPLSAWGCGIYGYYAGPGIHIVDEWALGDALLARLPAVRDLHWRIGHFTRAVPEGYLDSIATGRNQLRDPDVAQFWDRLVPVIREPIFSAKRWRAILDFALGRPARLLDSDRWRLPDLIAVDAAQFPAASGVAFGDSGVDVRFDPPSRAATVEIGFEGGRAFAVDWRRGGRVLASGRIDLPAGIRGEAVFTVEVPDEARKGFDRLRVLPLRGDGPYRLTRVSAPAAR